MKRRLSDALRSAKNRLGEESGEPSSPRTPSLHHYIRRDTGPRGLATVDDLLGRSDPDAPFRRRGEDAAALGLAAPRAARLALQTAEYHPAVHGVRRDGGRSFRSLRRTA